MNSKTVSLANLAGPIKFFNLPLTGVSKSDPTMLLMLNGSCSSSPRVGATGDKLCRQAPFSFFSLESAFNVLPDFTYENAFKFERTLKVATDFSGIN